MTPVETFWIGFALIFATVGVVRGFLKELGVTLVLIVTLFGLTRIMSNQQTILDFVSVRLKLPVVSQWIDRPEVWLAFYSFTILGAVFIAYQGYVITYPGENPKGIQGTLLALLVGFINGYLVAGSLWFYVNLYKDPVEKLGLLRLPYTSVAERLIPVLPPDMLGRYLPFLVVFMIILLVIK